MARFKQCLSRALNLIKTHVTNILQAASQHVKNSKVSVVLIKNLQNSSGVKHEMILNILIC